MDEYEVLEKRIEKCGLSLVKIAEKMSVNDHVYSKNDIKCILNGARQTYGSAYKDILSIIEKEEKKNQSQRVQSGKQQDSRDGMSHSSCGHVKPTSNQSGKQNCREGMSYNSNGHIELTRKVL